MGGSIPFPALDLRPVQQPDIMENYGRLLQLQNMAQTAPLQRQLMQQQVQSGQLENQQKQIQLKDQQGLSSAMQEWAAPKQSAPPSNMPQGMTGGPPAPTTTMPDYDSLLDLARKKGVSFSAYQGLQKSILDMKEKAATIAKDDAQTGSDQANQLKTKNGMLTDAMSGVLSLPDDQLIPGLLSAAQDLGQKGLLDPQHVQMAQQLAQSGDPATIRKTLGIQIAGMGGFSKMLDEATKKTDLLKKQGESDPNSPFFNPSAPAVAMGKAPGTAAVQAGEVKLGAQKAAADAAARQPFEMRLAQQRQALTQGDPKAAAQLLLDGDATLSELKARGSTPEFIAATLSAAHQMSGGKYNAQQSEAQFDVAKSPANVAFFGSAKSLTDKGGTLDQLAEAAKTIPANQIPAFNSAADWAKAATGNGPLAKYASLVLGVADDYSKVMGGGQGSDSSRTQALNLIAAKQSPEQRAASIEGIRGAVTSQTNSRIGNNPVLKRMYGGGEASAAPVAPSPQTHTFSLGAWQKANPKGDPNAAKAAAEQQGYQVVQ